jgi:hypothetical protein
LEEKKSKSIFKKKVLDLTKEELNAKSQNLRFPGKIICIEK